MPQILYNNEFIKNEKPAHSEKLLEEKINSGDVSKLSMIVPTGKIVRRLKQQSILKYWVKFRKPAPAFNFFTLRSFVEYLYYKLPLRNKPRLISDAYRLALCEEAAEKARLKYFTRSGKKISPLILRRLSDIIYGLKEDGITQDSVSEDLNAALSGQNKDIDIPRFSDIAAIYHSYESMLGDELIDFPGVISIVMSYFNGNNGNIKPISDYFPENALILFDSFSEFKKPEYEFISIFATAPPSCALILDYSVVNGPLFGNLEDTIISLTDSGFKLEPLISFNPGANKPNKDETDYFSSNLSNSEFLRRWLFNKERIERRGDYSSMIKIFAAKDRLGEVSCISKLIRHLIIEENISAADICVCIENHDDYPELFRESFMQYDIPANITDRYRLSESPVSVAVFAALDLVVRGFRKEDVRRAMHSPYLEFKEYDKKGNVKWEIDGVNLIALANKFRINGGNNRGGISMWIRRLDDAVSFYSSRTGGKIEDDFTDEIEYGEYMRYLNSCKLARADIEKFAGMFDFKGNKKYSPTEFSKIIKMGILVKFAVRRRIWDFYKSISELKGKLQKPEFIQLVERVERDTRSLAALIELLDEFTYITDNRFPGKKFTLELLVQKFKTAVSGVKYQVHEKLDFGVTVTSIEQTRNMQYQVMILCGMLDREFPSPYKPISFLGKELPGSEKKHQCRERMLFYRFLTNTPELLDSGVKRIFLFYPSRIGSEEGLRSPYIDALLKISTLAEDNCLYDLIALDAAAEKDKAQCTDIERKQLNDIKWLFSISSKPEKQEFASKFAYDDFINRKSLKNEILQVNPEVLPEYSSLLNFYSKMLSYEPGVVNPRVYGIAEVKNSGLKAEPVHQNIAMPEKVKAADKLSQMKNKIFSISELEKYAGCPFKFFISNILHIAEKTTPELSFSPLEKGSLLHSILYRFYKQLQSMGNDRANIANGTNFQTDNGSGCFNFVRLNPEKFNEYKIMLLNIAEDVISKNSFEHPFFEVEKLKMLGDGELPGILEKWLVAECDKNEAGWEFLPAMFELSFGMKGKNYGISIDFIELKDGLKIKGKIDRIEIFPSNDNFQFLVADYKSKLNKLPANEKIRKGMSFQMPVYIMAASQILKSIFNSPFQPAGAVYYCLNPEYNVKSRSNDYYMFSLLKPGAVSLFGEQKVSRSQMLKYDDELDEILQSTADFALKIIDDISCGKFPVEPLDGSLCRFCSYKPVCRFYEASSIQSEDSPKDTE